MSDAIQASPPRRQSRQSDAFDRMRLASLRAEEAADVALESAKKVELVAREVMAKSGPIPRATVPSRPDG